MKSLFQSSGRWSADQTVARCLWRIAGGASLIDGRRFVTGANTVAAAARWLQYAGGDDPLRAATSLAKTGLRRFARRDLRLRRPSQHQQQNLVVNADLDVSRTSTRPRDENTQSMSCQGPRPLAPAGFVDVRSAVCTEARQMINSMI